MNGRSPEYKCVYCGKFVSYKDIENGKVGYENVPESYYSREHIECWHISCKEKNERKDKNETNRRT